MNFPVVVMNFTHVYEDEHFLSNNLFQWIDCTKISGTDCYCSEESQLELKSIIKEYPAAGIHLIDSGNFHYLTKIWTDKIDYPFSLILFDHHPDMQPTLFHDLMSCGSWVRDMLENSHFLKKVIIIGASEKLKSETKEFSDRLLFFGEHSFENSYTWKEFSDINLAEPVYISVDKDVLSPEYARTNWDQGSLTLTELEKLLRTLTQKEEIIGVDICGENNYNADNFSSNDEMVNERTDKELVSFVFDMFGKDCK